MIGSKAKGRAYASQMLVQGVRRFIKRDHQSGAKGSRRGRGHGGAGSRPNRHLTCNQTPRLYKGVWTLRLERSKLLLPPLTRIAQGAL
jgi:hypothetical protein